MNNVNKTLYIPLYGKSYVSKKGIIIHDKKAEKIWATEGFELNGKSKSKWLAYYMGMRSKVFDEWLKIQMKNNPDAVILHIGCGMDSRIERVGTGKHQWYDIDFPDVICERKRYYQETENYYMIPSDVKSAEWVEIVSDRKSVIVIMEGVSMYLTPGELNEVLCNLADNFGKMNILMDCYTNFAAKASKYKNPINDVGVNVVYGIDEPDQLENEKIMYVQEHELTPAFLINELKGVEKFIFQKVFSGKLSKKMYRLYEYKA